MICFLHFLYHHYKDVLNDCHPPSRYKGDANYQHFMIIINTKEAEKIFTEVTMETAVYEHAEHYLAMDTYSTMYAMSTIRRALHVITYTTRCEPILH